jgi:hypothetical protein
MFPQNFEQVIIQLYAPQSEADEVNGPPLQLVNTIHDESDGLIAFE